MTSLESYLKVKSSTTAEVIDSEAIFDRFLLAGRRFIFLDTREITFEFTNVESFDSSVVNSSYFEIITWLYDGLKEENRNSKITYRIGNFIKDKDENGNIFYYLPFRRKIIKEGDST